MREEGSKRVVKEEEDDRRGVDFSLTNLGKEAYTSLNFNRFILFFIKVLFSQRTLPCPDNPEACELAVYLYRYIVVMRKWNFTIHLTFCSPAEWINPVWITGSCCVCSKGEGMVVHTDATYFHSVFVPSPKYY